MKYMARPIAEDDPNPELGRAEHALIFIALCAMLVRQELHAQSAYPRVRGIRAALHAHARPELNRSDCRLVRRHMQAFLVREAHGWATGMKCIRKLQAEIDNARARGELQSEDHSD